MSARLALTLLCALGLASCAPSESESEDGGSLPPLGYELADVEAGANATIMAASVEETTE